MHVFIFYLTVWCVQVCVYLSLETTASCTESLQPENSTAPWPSDRSPSPGCAPRSRGCKGQRSPLADFLSGARRGDRRRHEFFLSLRWPAPRRAGLGRDTRDEFEKQPEENKQQQQHHKHALTSGDDLCIANEHRERKSVKTREARGFTPQNNKKMWEVGQLIHRGWRGPSGEPGTSWFADQTGRAYNPCCAASRDESSRTTRTLCTAATQQTHITLTRIHNINTHTEFINLQFVCASCNMILSVKITSLLLF